MKKKISKPDDLSVEIAFLEGLRGQMPQDTCVLKLLGDDYTTAGRIQAGLEVDLQLASLLPADPTVHYNLACSHSLVGELRESAQALCRAIRLGYDEWDWMRKDEDLDNLRHSVEYVSVTSLVESRCGQKV